MDQSHFTFRASRSGDGGKINMPRRELALGSGIREDQDKALTLPSIYTGNKASIASQCSLSGEVSLRFPAQQAPSLLLSITETPSLPFIFLFIWKVQILISLSHMQKNTHINQKGPVWGHFKAFSNLAFIFLTPEKLALDILWFSWSHIQQAEDTKSSLDFKNVTKFQDKPKGPSVLPLNSTTLFT